VTQDNGQNWTRIEVGDLPGVPEMAFVNDIKADLYDVNTAYVVLDNHKFGDLEPYILKSTDMGKNWKSIRGDLPGRTLLWRMVQDHERKDLFFLATEFGIYFTIDSGEKWNKLSGGLPTISFRDLAIQQRESDLVGASFGRSFYILDDFSPLRYVSEEQLNEEATLFPVKDAWWYPQRRPLGGREKGSQGAGFFTAPNPPYGAVFTYYLKDTYMSKKDIRREKEKELTKNEEDIPFPGWDSLEAERRQESALIWFTIRDSKGNVFRKMNGPSSKGIHRVAWDFRSNANWAIEKDIEYPPKDDPSGTWIIPGTYTVQLSKEIDGIVTDLSEPVRFEVKQLREGALKGSTQQEIADYRREVDEMKQAVGALSITMNNTKEWLNALRLALFRTPVNQSGLATRLHDLNQELLDLDEQLNGNRTKQEVGENSPPTVRSRLNVAAQGSYNMLYGPTITQKENLQLAITAYRDIRKKVEEITDHRIPTLEKDLKDAGAPWIEGQPLPEK
jgi:hypothetical protein